MSQMKCLLAVAAMLWIGAGAANAQAGSALAGMANTPSLSARLMGGAGIPLGASELRPSGLSPNVPSLPSPATSFGSSQMTMPGGTTGFAGSETSMSPSFGTPLVNHRITNYGAGGMQRMPGSPLGSNR